MNTRVSVDDVMAAPIAVALLNALIGDGFAPDDISLGELLGRVVRVAYDLAGPWSADLLGLADAYENVAGRRDLARRLIDAHGEAMAAPLDLTGQQLWLSDSSGVARSAPRRLFRDFGDVYGNGEFCWSGLWTTGELPAEVHDGVQLLWDFDGRASRWRLPVETTPRLRRVDGPADWAGLVADYPMPATRAHDGWELPGPNRHLQYERLETASAGAAMRTRLTADHLLPDWAAVAADYEAVHLSWLGFVTTEGRITDIGEDVTMLRYWGSQRTLWLRDCFGEPEPLPAPAVAGVDVRVDHQRAQRDLTVLRTWRGR